MSTARRKSSDNAAAPKQAVKKSSSATRGTVDRKSKTATGAADAPQVTKAAAPKRVAAGTKAAAAPMPASPARIEPTRTEATRATAERADMIVDRETMIRERAYLRYLERGGGSGQAMADWLEAEREVDEERPERGEPA